MRGLRQKLKDINRVNEKERAIIHKLNELQIEWSIKGSNDLLIASLEEYVCSDTFTRRSHTEKKNDIFYMKQQLDLIKAISEYYEG